MEYSIKFTDNCSQKLRAKLIDCFKSAGLLCESLYEGENTVYIGATFEALVNKVVSTIANFGTISTVYFS